MLFRSLLVLSNMGHRSAWSLVELLLSFFGSPWNESLSRGLLDGRLAHLRGRVRDMRRPLDGRVAEHLNARACRALTAPRQLGKHPPRGEDDFAHVRTRGQGIEGRPPSGTPRGCRAFKRVSAMSPSRGRAAARQTGAPPSPLRRPPRPPTGSWSSQGCAGSAARPSCVRDGAARAAGRNDARAARRGPRAHGRGALAVRGST